MKLKRGILIGVALYFAIFVLGVVMTIISIKTVGLSTSASTLYWILTIVSTVLLTCLAGLWYFNKTKRNALEGLKLGIVFGLVGLVIDLFFFVILFFFDSDLTALKFIDYYTTSSYYITLMLVIASTVFVGTMGKQEKSNKEVKNKKELKKSKTSKKR